MMPQEDSLLEKSELKGYGGNDTNYSMTSNDRGERVKVAVRCRPMQPHELARNDGTCIECIDSNNIILKIPG